MRGNDLNQSEVHQYDGMFHRNTGTANNGSKKVESNQQLLDYRLFTGQYELQKARPAFEDSFDGFDETAKIKREQFKEEFKTSQSHKSKYLVELQKSQPSEQYRARPTQQHYKSPVVNNAVPEQRFNRPEIRSTDRNQNIKSFNNAIDQIHLPAEMQRPSATRDQVKEYYHQQDKDKLRDYKSLSEQKKNNEYINSHQFMPLSGPGNKTVPGFDYYMVQTEKSNGYEDQF